MASPTWWTWVWASSRSWWWTGRPGVLQSMGPQRVRHDWVTELNWISIYWSQYLWCATKCQAVPWACGYSRDIKGGSSCSHILFFSALLPVIILKKKIIQLFLICAPNSSVLLSSVKAQNLSCDYRFMITRICLTWSATSHYTWLTQMENQAYLWLSPLWGRGRGVLLILVCLSHCTPPLSLKGPNCCSTAALCYACVLGHFSCVWFFVILWSVPTRLLCPWDSPGKNTGVSCYALLQGIFPTQGPNSCLLWLLHCRWIIYLSLLCVSCWVMSDSLQPHGL